MGRHCFIKFAYKKLKNGPFDDELGTQGSLYASDYRIKFQFYLNRIVF